MGLSQNDAIGNGQDHSLQGIVTTSIVGSGLDRSSS